MVIEQNKYNNKQPCASHTLLYSIYPPDETPRLSFYPTQKPSFNLEQFFFCSTLVKRSLKNFCGYFA